MIKKPFGQVGSRFYFWLSLARAQERFASEGSPIYWIVLDPALKSAVYVGLFGVLLPSELRPDNFVQSVLLGVSLFEIFQFVVNRSLHLVTDYKSLSQVVRVSEAGIAFSIVVEGILLAGPFVVIALTVSGFSGVISLHGLLFALFILLLFALFCWVLSLAVGAIDTLLAGFRRLVGLLNRLVFYSSGIFWSLEEALKDYPELLGILRVNPVFQTIESFRAALYGASNDWTMWFLVVIGWSGAFLALWILLRKLILRGWGRQ